MLVRELMTTDVVTVHVNATLDEAVGALLDNGVGSVVVVEDGVPTGIVRLTDIVWSLADIRKEASDLAEKDWGPGVR